MSYLWLPAIVQSLSVQLMCEVQQKNEFRQEGVALRAEEALAPLQVLGSSDRASYSQGSLRHKWSALIEVTSLTRASLDCPSERLSSESQKWSLGFGKQNTWQVWDLWWVPQSCDSSFEPG